MKRANKVSYFVKFECQTSTIMLYRKLLLNILLIKHFMHDIMRDIKQGPIILTTDIKFLYYVSIIRSYYFIEALRQAMRA